MRVHQLLTTVLNSVAKDLKIVGTVSNGDILQALSMALAVRSRMVYAPEQTMRTIVTDLTETALNACYQADGKAIRLDMVNGQPAHLRYLPRKVRPTYLKLLEKLRV